MKFIYLILKGIISVAPIFFIGAVIHFSSIRPQREYNSNKVLELKERLNALDSISIANNETDSELLFRIKENLISKKPDLSNAMKIEGNSIILYSEDFGEIVDVYLFQQKLASYFPEYTVETVKKKR